MDARERWVDAPQSGAAEQRDGARNVHPSGGSRLRVEILPRASDQSARLRRRMRGAVTEPAAEDGRRRDERAERGEDQRLCRPSQHEHRDCQQTSRSERQRAAPDDMRSAKSSAIAQQPSERELRDALCDLAIGQFTRSGARRWPARPDAVGHKHVIDMRSRNSVASTISVARRRDRVQLRIRKRTTTGTPDPASEAPDPNPRDRDGACRLGLRARQVRWPLRVAFWDASARR